MIYNSCYYYSFYVCRYYVTYVTCRAIPGLFLWNSVNPFAEAVLIMRLVFGLCNETS